MLKPELSLHAQHMLEERNIPEIWVWQTIENPDKLQVMEDGTLHYLRMVVEYGSRYLRVIVNPSATPPRVITVFFDRRLRKENETES